MIRIKDMNRHITFSHQDDLVTKAIQLLRSDLYQINLISKFVDRKILSLAYSPGVGAVCLDIVKDLKQVNRKTLRGRSIAIVSDGSMLGSQGKQFMPVMDWMIAQLKYYFGIDSFPFVIDPSSDLNETLLDLSSCFRGVLYLDSKQFQKVPKDFIVVKQKEIVNHFKCQQTNVYWSGLLISYMLAQGLQGLVTQQHYGKCCFERKPSKFLQKEPANFVFEDKKSYEQQSIVFHQFYRGKIKIQINFEDIAPLENIFIDSTFEKIVKMSNIYSKTSTLSAIVTDGTAILGLGNIGPSAGLPVMEGKSLLFKLLGGVEVVPACIYPKKSVQAEVTAISNLLCNFAAVNLQDIKAPQCFAIQNELKRLALQPIFHDDQHGTAIVVLAGLINALSLTKRTIQSCKVVINGAGAAGRTIAKILLQYGAKNLIVCDTKGAIYRGRTQNMNDYKRQIAQLSNPSNFQGPLQSILKGADVFIGVSQGNILKAEDIANMNKDCIVFALANPIPEIGPEQAKKGGAYIYGSGRSDYPNQINNSLVFPGIFKAIKQHGLKQITQAMKLKAAKAIAKGIKESINSELIIPDSLDKDIPACISQALKP